MRGLLFISVFGLGLVFTQATSRLDCIPNYVKCRDSASTEEQRDDCIWKFIHCIKEDCDTHVCDGYGKKCLEAATTHEGKHVCALEWFRCVQKMHTEICHTKTPEDIEESNDSPMNWFGKHKHRSTTTQSPHTITPSKQTPSMCYSNLKKCHAHAHSVREEGACMKSYATCMKRMCNTGACDLSAKSCLKRAKTTGQKLRCGYGWIKCVRSSEHRICRIHYELDDENIFGHHHKHSSSTTQKPSVTPARCGCYCQYTHCNAHARSVQEKDACIKSYQTCVKRICDTRYCDKKTDKCMKKAKTHEKQHRCQVDWFKCVKKYQKKICHKRA